MQGFQHTRPNWVVGLLIALALLPLPGVALAKGPVIRSYLLRGDFSDARLEQVAKDGRVLLSRGNDMDTTRSYEIWQDNGARRTPLQLGAKSSSSPRLTPDEIAINEQSGEIAFGINWTIGVTDLKDLDKYHLLAPVAKNPDESSFYGMPIWMSEHKLAVLSIKDWGSLVQFDTVTGNKETLFASQQLFVSDYSANRNHGIVISAGPTDQNLIQSYINKKNFFVAPIRAARENLYLLPTKPGAGLRQLTKGNWHDIGPKISPDGSFVAFLRGRVTKAMVREDYIGGHVDLYSRFKQLYVVNTRTDKIRRIYSGTGNTTLDYAWETGNVLSYSTGKIIKRVDAAISKTTSIYRAKGRIVSYLKDPYWHTYDLLESRNGHYYFVVVKAVSVPATGR